METRYIFWIIISQAVDIISNRCCSSERGSNEKHDDYISPSEYELKKFKYDNDVNVISMIRMCFITQANKNDINIKKHIACHT